MDLNVMLAESAKKIEAEGLVQKKVDEVVLKTMNSIIDDLFGNWSPFSKELKSKISEELNIDLKKLNIPQYNHMILNVVEKKLDEAITLTGMAQLKAELDILLGSGDPPSYKLSDIIKEMKSQHEDDEDYFGKEISLHVDEGNSLTFIYFDEEEDKAGYECKYKVTIRTEDGSIVSAKIDGTNFDNALIMGGLYGVEKMLFKLYSMKGTLVNDEQYVEMNYDDPRFD